jgi:uncharacterized protein YqeY
MSKYETLKADMTTALKEGNKVRRLTIADMVASIDKASVGAKSRAIITDQLVDEVLLKYRKTVKEMIDTCPDDEKYAGRKAEYREKLAIVEEYAPKVIDDVDEIVKMINLCAITNGVSVTSGNKGPVTKLVMPFLKKSGCDMTAAKAALDKAMAQGDVVLEAQLNGTGDN